VAAHGRAWQWMAWSWAGLPASFFDRPRYLQRSGSWPCARSPGGPRLALQLRRLGSSLLSPFVSVSETLLRASPLISLNVRSASSAQPRRLSPTMATTNVAAVGLITFVPTAAAGSCRGRNDRFIVSAFPLFSSFPPTSGSALPGFLSFSVFRLSPSLLSYSHPFNSL
jgi:hypothetical protein